MGLVLVCFFFQAEDGIRGGKESRGLGEGYKRQVGRVLGAPSLGSVYHLVERVLRTAVFLL